MKKAIIACAFIIFIAAVFILSKNPPSRSLFPISPTPTATLVGGDRDEHGCIPSAGYSWCEEKQKCLRVWEEPCAEGLSEEETEVLKAEIKALLINKRGKSAEELDITVSEVNGNYAKGGAGKTGLGGGMWFAAKVDNDWKLVWDGNGIITCNSLKDFPDYPSIMIPQCFDESKQEMVDR